MSTKQEEQRQYEDMIHLPHHVSSRHPQMSMTDRAAQFSPFAALTGYGDAVREKARLTEQKPDLSEEERAELDYKLQMACGPDSEGERPEVRITYFVPDRKKAASASEVFPVPAWPTRATLRMFLALYCFMCDSPFVYPAEEHSTDCEQLCTKYAQTNCFALIIISYPALLFN